MSSALDQSWNTKTEHTISNLNFNNNGASLSLLVALRSQKTNNVRMRDNNNLEEFKCDSVEVTPWAVHL